MMQARIERQAGKVARLSRELRFELLLLRRMRSRAGEGLACEPRPAGFTSLAEVYAAALLRRSEDEGG